MQRSRPRQNLIHKFSVGLDTFQDLAVWQPGGFSKHNIELVGVALKAFQALRDPLPERFMVSRHTWAFVFPSVGSSSIQVEYCINQQVIRRENTPKSGLRKRRRGGGRIGF